MWFASFSRRGRKRQPSRHPSCSPRLEPLEGRAVPATFTVHNLADSGEGSLRAAILGAESSPGADLVEFAPHVEGKITLTTGELLISSDLTIEGPGADRLKVSGNDASRVFRVVGGADEGTAIAVTISDLTITRGRAEDAGGGILNSAYSELTLNGVALVNNLAVAVTGPNATGGAVHSNGIGSVLTIVDSRIVGNTADGRDAIRAIGGGIAVDSGSLSVLDSTVANNRALGGAEGVALGGGIRLRSASATIAGSVLRNNHAIGGPDGGEGFGGGIGVAFSSLDLRDSTLIGNEARGGDGGLFGLAAGGAIDNPTGSVSISDSRLSGNRAVAGNGGTNAGDDFSVGTAWGGAVSNGGVLEINQSVIRGNQAVGGDNATHANAPNTADVGAAHGGAIANIGGAELTIRESVVAHNRAIAGNGNTGNGPVAFVGSATGGAIDNSLDLFIFGEPEHVPARLTMINTTLRGNRAVGGDNNTGSGGSVFAGAGLGGGIANYLGALAEVDGSLLVGNRAISGIGGLGAGGGIFNGIGEVPAPDGPIVVPTSVTVHDSTLRNNAARGGPGGDGLGGGIFTETELTLSESTVTRNRALGGRGDGEGVGGGVYNLGEFDVDAMTFIGNNVASTSDDDLFE